MTWYTIREGDEGSGLGASGIYQWRLNGVAIYTGQASNLASRLRQYENNLTRLEGDLPYRRGNPDGFRDIHHGLFRAVREGIVPEFQVVEFCSSASLNERERHHQRVMAGDAPLRDFQARSGAEHRIAQAVRRCERPDNDDVRIWLRGGATFWNEDHLFLTWGLYLNDAVDDEAIESLGIRTAILESDDLAREKFGAIVLRGVDTSKAVAITAWNGFWGDRLFGFFVDAEEFLARAPQHGWLLGKERDLSDAIARVDDEELMATWSSGNGRLFTYPNVEE